MTDVCLQKKSFFSQELLHHLAYFELNFLIVFLIFVGYTNLLSMALLFPFLSPLLYGVSAQLTREK